MAHKLDYFIFTPMTIQFNLDMTKKLHEPTMLGVVFGYWQPFWDCLAGYCLKADLIKCWRLINSYPVSISINKGCLVISNES